MITIKKHLLKKISLQIFFFNLFLLFTFFFPSSIISQIPPKPDPPKLYNNFSEEFPNFLSEDEAIIIEDKLEQFSRETSNQIVVVVVDDFGEYTAVEYATFLGEEWGVGKEDKDNGIVILIKPTGEVGERELFIAVGTGLEGAIPDLATKKIRENIMQPLFAEEKFYEGLDKGLDALMKLAKGEINEQDLPNGNESKIGKIFKKILIVLRDIVAIIIIIIFLAFGSGSSSGSSWSGSSGSSSRSSGSRGWSGFGGGSFGGGGSGGKW